MVASRRGFLTWLLCFFSIRCSAFAIRRLCGSSLSNGSVSRGMPAAGVRLVPRATTATAFDARSRWFQIHTKWACRSMGLTRDNTAGIGDQLQKSLLTTR
jgi:hypothetical protein